MDVKEVAELAKALVKDLFASEGAHSIRLEEIIHQNKDLWQITISFLRSPIEAPSGIATFIAAADRAYKVVEIRESNRSIASVRDKARAA